MKKLFNAILIPAALLAGMASCSDFLEPENRANIEADSYFATDEGLAQLRVTEFTGLRSLVTNVDLTEWGTDLYVTSKSSDPGDFHRYNVTPENSTVESYYKACYSLINMANCMLKYGAANEQYAAEAMFLRCYGYYRLVQQFGAVPYVTSYIESGATDYPRTPLSELYPALISELEGIATSSALPAEDHNGNPSQRAVQALLAHICLEAAWDLETTLNDAAQGTCSVTGNTYFQKTAKYADMAIAGQDLTMSFEDKWYPANEGNAEEIFSVQYERNGYPGNVLTGGHTRQSTYGSQLGDPAVTGLKNCNGALVPSTKSLYLWAKGDARYEATFMTTMYNYFGSWPATGYYAYYEASEATRSTMGIADKYFPWYYTKNEVDAYISEHAAQFVKGEGPNSVHVHLMADPMYFVQFNLDGSVSSRTTPDYASYLRVNNAAVPAVKKFDDPTSVQQSGIQDDYRDIVVFHLSQLYLVAAEAYLMLGDESSSLARINQIRRRAGAGEISSYAAYEPDYRVSDIFGEERPIDLILDERARECYAETTRWQDLRRTRQLVRYNVEFNEYVTQASDMANVKGEIKWYRPIPAAEISTNTSISAEDHNPGY